MLNNFKNGKIEINDSKTFYIKFGTGKKNLIIIPGVGDGFKTVKGFALPFSVMYKSFTKDYTVYVFSRRSNLPKKFSTEQMANDIIDYMDYLKIDVADAIGVSQVGMIAEYLAINAPNRIKKLVLVVTCARPNKILKENSRIWIEMANKKDFKSIMLDTADKSYVGKYLEKNKKAIKVLSLFYKNATYDRFITEVESCLNHNAFDKLNKIKCKTLIIGAEKDKMLGIEGSKELNNNIKNSELYIYKDYSHGVYEQAKDFNDRVLEFLRK